MAVKIMELIDQQKHHFFHNKDNMALNDTAVSGNGQLESSPTLPHTSSSDRLQRPMTATPGVNFHPGQFQPRLLHEPPMISPMQRFQQNSAPFGHSHPVQFNPNLLGPRGPMQNNPMMSHPGPMAHPHLMGLGPMGGPLMLGPGGMGLAPRIPSSDDACASIVHSLMDHRQRGDSDQFTKRAIESLVKKLRERKDELEALIFAVTTGGAQRTRCVTIQRTLDGRLQVAGKKGFPHVIYAKIWRWPDLHKNELRHVAHCQFAFDLKLDSVCVNPYHYERVVSPCPELLPLGPEDSAAFTQQQRFDRSPNTSGSPGSPGPQPVSSPIVSSHGSVQLQQMTQPTFTTPYLSHPPPPGHMGVIITPPQQQHAPNSTNGPEEAYNPTSGSFNTIPSPMIRPPIAPAVNFDQKPPALATPLELWCTINYFELNVHVGQPFKVPFECTTVVIDGFTDPNGVARFCLGCLSNVHRDEVVERARPHIGKGIELRHDEGGDVWLKVNSEQSVFLESPYLDSQCGDRPAVHKIYSTALLKVFDLKYSYRKMLDQAQHVQLARNMMKANIHGVSPEMAAAQNVGVDDYQKHCVLRMSFVKGFGPDYNRKRIEDTPCWIEVKLHWPLKILDQLLQPLDDAPNIQQHRDLPQQPQQPEPKQESESEEKQDHVPTSSS